MDLFAYMALKIQEWMIIWFFFQTVLSQGIDRAWMDDVTTCSQKTTVFVHDGKSLMVQAKGTQDGNPLDIKQCEIIVGPFDENRSLIVQFDTFYIQTCAVRVKISQGKFSTMVDEKPLKTLDCYTKGKAKDQSFTLQDKNMYMRLLLLTDDPQDVRYNFRLNITAVPYTGAQNSGLSIGVKIGIAVLSVVAFIMILYFIIKTIRVRMSLKEDLETSESGTNLENLQSVHLPHSNAYVPLPSKDSTRHVGVRQPDPDIYFEYNPSGTQSRIIDTSSPHTAENNGSKSLPPSPPPYDEALGMARVSDEPSNTEYANINQWNT